MKSWLIGSEDQCDLIVRESGVSSCHCILKLTDDGFLIDDLDSTNGTFVNGTKLNGPAIVTPDDKITLGPSLAMPWPSDIDSETVVGVTPRVVPQDRKLYKIGRFPGNDIVLARDMVSGHHANLVVEDGRLSIEDVGSTNGTAVGNKDNFVERVEVSENDMVFFGSFSIKVTHLLAAVRKSESESESKAASKQHTTREDKHSGDAGVSKTKIVAGFGIAAAILVVAWVVWRSPDNENELSDSKSPDVQSAFSQSASASGNPDGGKAKLLATGKERSSQKSKTYSKAANALFVIYVHSDASETTFQTGTAWLAKNDLLITTAEVITTIRKLKASGYDRVGGIQSGTGQSIEITNFGTNVQYDVINAQYLDGRKQYETLQRAVGELETNIANTNDQLKAELQKQSRKIIEDGLQLQAVRDGYNLGWLRLAEAPKVSASTPFSSLGSIRERMDLHLHAIPFANDDPVLNPENRLEPLGVAIKTVRRMDSSDPSVPRRWLMSGADLLEGYDYEGSPIFNLQGNLVAMYARAASKSESLESGIEQGLFEALTLESILAAFAELGNGERK